MKCSWRVCSCDMQENARARATQENPKGEHGNRGVDDINTCRLELFTVYIVL